MNRSASLRARACFHPPAALTAGFVAVLVGYGSCAVILFPAAMSDDASREAALITFTVTASGLTLFGIGAAFRDLLAGGISSFAFTRIRP